MTCVCGTQVSASNAMDTTQTSSPAAVDITFWQEVVDPKTNHAYFWNPKTNEVSWTLPEGGVISAPPSQPAAAEEDEDIDSLMESYPHLKKPIPVVPVKTGEQSKLLQELIFIFSL